jgi:histidinol phosphatase-like enzyme (inositol monophosphatase family)
MSGPPAFDPSDPAALGRALDLAVRAATEPRAAILAHFRSPELESELKPDGSPVTKADVEAEAAIRALLRASAEFGGLGVLGEEGGLAGKPTPWRWVIDPIDGTRAFVRGLPTFGTIVALEETESARPLVGVIHLPVTGETLAAARGLGAWRDGRRLRVSAAGSLRSAIVSLPDLVEFRAAGMEGAYAAVHAVCDHVRGYTDCWAHAQVIAGAVDALVEPGLSPWDVRATEVLVAEAGGACRLRRSRVEGKMDLLCGSPALVHEIAQLIGFA